MTKAGLQNKTYQMKPNTTNFLNQTKITKISPTDQTKASKMTKLQHPSKIYLQNCQISTMPVNQSKHRSDERLARLSLPCA